MSWLQKLRFKLNALLKRKQLDAGMDEEMRLHIDLQTQENINAGMSAEEARYAALRQFGWVESIKDKCREQRGVSWLEDLAGDLRLAFRQLARAKSFTLIAVLTIALGVGVNVSMFSGLQAVLSPALAYPEPDRLVRIFRAGPGSGRDPHSAANFLDCQAQNTVFERMAAWTDRRFNLGLPGQAPERVEGLQVTASFFPLLGIQPLLGRFFLPEEDQPGRNNVVILSHQFWLRRFAGDSNIVGQTIRLDGEQMTVVGVMPERFRDILLAGPAALWRPIGFTEEQRQSRSHSYLKCIGRVKPGISIEQARAGMDALASRLAGDYPGENTALGFPLSPLSGAAIPPQGKTMLWSVMALSGFVLLIACANLANLQLARTATRERELAVRSALGAPRRRLLRQLLTESLALAFLGGALGTLLARWGNLFLSRQFSSADEELTMSIPLDWRALGFALAAAALSGLAFGLLPAWLASRTDVNTALKQGSRGSTGDKSRHGLQHALIVAEVAMALALLAGAGLLVSGLRGFATQDPGWNVDRLTVGYLTLPKAKYGSSAAQAAFAERLEEKLAALPGAESAALAWNLPLRQFNVTTSFSIAGQDQAPNGHALTRYLCGVTPGYFKTLGMRLHAGRVFNSGDTASSPPVVIINETMARVFWPGQSPLGKRIGEEEIVGVVSDIRFPANPGEQRTSFQTYRPMSQSPSDFLAVALRGGVTAGMLRTAVAELDPDQPVGEAGTARAEMRRSLDNWGVGGRLLTSFAALGLGLAALGIYGVISGFVARRTSEIGIRMALGAQVRDVLWLVLGKGLKLSLAGTALGLLGAHAVRRILGSVLPGLPSSPIWVAVLVCATLIGVTLLACWIPARRAARVDPLHALRSE